uniref:Resistance to inhibitors of cholinesterase protein 3 N-terminal domain-containing protein n=1 Tax=Ditylenchus dipsaci TaxID=166011 RepID=A0A915EB50_9BILA
MSSDVFTRLRQQIDEDVAAEDRRRKRRKKRRNSDYEDDEDRDNIMPKWKMCLVGAAIFTCFALLYPSVFSPMLNTLFGRGGSSHPEHLKTPRPPGRPQTPRPGHPSHMHPAAAAAQMRMPQAEAAQQSMVGFLLYTFFKPKKGKKKPKNTSVYLDESTQSESDEDVPNMLGRKKLNSVQQRLQKTEAAMRQILEQLEGLACQVNPHENTAFMTSQNTGDPEQKLSPQQVKAMEKSLQDLKILSELCKEQRAEVEEVISEEEEDQENSEEILPTEDSEQEDELEDESTDEREEEREHEQTLHYEPHHEKPENNKSIRKRIRREK